MRYPKAEWLGNGQSGGSYTSGPRKVVLHTTETRTLPGYQGGATAPHLTYAPASRRWYQHTDLNVAARALRNEAGGEQTNRDSAWQVEIICYSAQNIAEQVNGLWVGNLSKPALDDLREFIKWAGVQFVWPNKRALSYSEANAAGFRMSASEWTNFGGVCGHQHVVENTHWDPGALDWAYLMVEGGEDDMITKWLDESAWRTLYRRGVVRGASEEAVVKYWYTDRALREESEHISASSNIIEALSIHPAPIPGPKGDTGATGKTGARGPAGPPPGPGTTFTGTLT